MRTSEFLRNFYKKRDAINEEENFITRYSFIFSLKTRYPELNDPERLRPHIDEFLTKVQLTDAILLYAPSQVRGPIQKHPFNTLHIT